MSETARFYVTLLALVVAVVLITLVIAAAVFQRYEKQARRRSLLEIGKAWSIMLQAYFEEVDPSYHETIRFSCTLAVAVCKLKWNSVTPKLVWGEKVFISCNLSGAAAFDQKHIEKHVLAQQRSGWPRHRNLFVEYTYNLSSQKRK